VKSFQRNLKRKNYACVMILFCQMERERYQEVVGSGV
jgi:hypothetical protein